jgi:hypothetical protein
MAVEAATIAIMRIVICPRLLPAMDLMLIYPGRRNVSFLGS